MGDDSEGVPLPLPRTSIKSLLPREPGACTLCPSDSILLDSECLKSLREVSTTSSESSNVLKALRETVRQSQKSMKFHSKRLVLLTEDDLSGHVFCASKGAADLVSELSSSIEDALLCVDSYRRQLESMAETISSGRRCEAVARDTGITFASGSDETLSRPEADFAVSLKQPEQSASEEGQEVKQAKRGYSRIRSLLRAGSKMSDLGREQNPGPFLWSVFFRELVKSPTFDLTFAVLILISSLVMALQVQYHGFDVGFALGYWSARPANEWWPGAEPVIQSLEFVLGVVFLFEILVRILAERCRFWCDPWNVLDLSVVVAWGIDTATAASLPVDPMLLRLLRLVKLFRLLRLIRKVKGFDSLYIMVTSIKASFSALLWSTVLLSAVLMTIALVLTTLVDVYLNNESNPLERRLHVFKYYGTFTRCSLTLLELTLANWVPASRVLTEDVSEFYTIFVLIFQASMGFSVVKVIMGVFLQNTFSVVANDDVIMMNSKDRALQTHKLKMSILFSAADTDGNGRLDREEFAEILADPLVSRWLMAMGFDTSIMSSDEIFDLLRSESESSLSAQEMIDGVARLSGPASSLNMAQLLYEGEGLRREVQSFAEQMHQRLVELGVETRRPPELPQPTLNSKQKKSSVSSFSASKSKMAVSQKLFSQKRLASFHASSRGLRRISKHAKLITESFHFQLTFALLICSLCAVMGFEVQYRGLETGHQLGYTGHELPAKDVWPYAETGFEIMDIFFGAAFTLELLLKILADGLSFLKDFWNWLDGLVLIVWYFERLTSAAFPLEPMMLRLFRLSRLMRMVRLVKIFEQCDALYLMLTSIRASFAALAWSSALLLLSQMMFALVLVILVEPYLSSTSSTGDKNAVYSYYGTFTRAMLTLFEITLGNFVPVTRLMMQDVSELYVIFALVHKLVIGFAVVMVITGVFVQETMTVAQTDNTIMINQKERAHDLHVAKMTALFKAADFDSSGRLDRGEWLQVCDDYSVQLWLAAMGLDVSDAELVHKLICWKSCREDLNAKDLVSGIARLQGNARNIDMALFRKEFLHTTKVVKDVQQKVQAWSTDIGRKECGVVGPWLLETLAFNLIAMVGAAIGHTTASCCLAALLTLPLAKVALREFAQCYPGHGLQAVWQLKRLPPETAVLLLPGALVLYAGGWHELKGDLEDEDESNWKRIYGDVLRPPRCASLLALLVAIGVAQIPVLGEPTMGALAGFVFARLRYLLRLSPWAWLMLVPLAAPFSHAVLGLAGAYAVGIRLPPLEQGGFFQGFHAIPRELPPATCSWPLIPAALCSILLGCGAQPFAPCCLMAVEVSLLHTCHRLQQENHRWQWSSFGTAVLLASCFQTATLVELAMSPDTARLLEAFQRICFTAAVAYLMNLRMVLFAYSLCVCD